MTRPLCFVLIPSGKNFDAAGSIVDFDAIYRDLIAPAIELAGLDPLRARHETTGVQVHVPTFEHLILCDYAVADLTIADANVFYELGVRRAVRPGATVLLFPAGTAHIPFDSDALCAIPYHLTAEGTPAGIEMRQALAARLRDARQGDFDSPVIHLVRGFSGIEHTKTDVFRDRAQYSAQIKERLAQSRNEGVEAVRRVERDLGDISDVGSGIVIDLLLSYRAMKAWEDLVALTQKMAPPLAATRLVQEQLALALNRNGRGEQAEAVLEKLIETHGPSSETYSILGRVYKDRWDAARDAGAGQAPGLLDKAIDNYLRGFEADWRDAYPGINAVTLMELKEPLDPRRESLIPVVSYAVERRIDAGQPDYWDHATRLELAVLTRNEQQAAEALGDALGAIREVWEPETTARNLRLIREARARRGEYISWAATIEESLGQYAET